MINREEIFRSIDEEKRKENYIKALSLYGELLKENIYDFNIYSSMAKIYYLLGDYDASVRFNLISIHLSIIESEEILKTDTTISKEMNEMIKKIKGLTEELSKVDKILKNLIFCEPNLIHLGHSLLDSTLNDESKETYLKILKGEKIDIDEKYKKSEMELFYPFGILFSAVMIESEIKREEIVEYYLSYDSSEMRTVYEKVLKLYEEFKFPETR
ncbi:MAG: hypothetical protein XD76_0375 [candidate division TA06 bacterium 32_111]|uniref:Tetratricopeptide repeat protein n=2 Tax=Bacteria candidate phyla TaxID=1783234 RepID=A0A124G0I8_UNCT6|nr:MAG: hypothetical protein XD76_0375 [candidate division TA06 bacterium 32_111]KUK87592.1 MAG: hypothetical protein XE03_0483 [candidate division TA06 bacterium 34_109]HAF07431.1 hypothetical protein [candidate division WOR-3 bacterium]HCP17500.1 hypothetical protein [candidate division WOR-3 bacterium]